MCKNVHFGSKAIIVPPQHQCCQCCEYFVNVLSVLMSNIISTLPLHCTNAFTEWLQHCLVGHVVFFFPETLNSTVGNPFTSDFALFPSRENLSLGK